MGHTPTPWKINEGGTVITDNSGLYIIRGGTFDGSTMQAPGSRTANAAFIVKAVNAHETLVSALRSAKQLCDNINEFGHVTDQEYHDAAETAIREALTKAGVL